MEKDVIVILGASTNPLRPSYSADVLLKKQGFETVHLQYGSEKVDEGEKPLLNRKEKTVTIFLKPNQQKKYYNFILSLRPSRIIFNPGTENEEFDKIAYKNNIKVMKGCTIALLVNRLL